MQAHEAAAWNCVRFIGEFHALCTLQIELERILDSMKNLYGGTQYAAVHERVEDDFKSHCWALSNGSETAMQALVRQQTLSNEIRAT